MAIAPAKRIVELVAMNSAVPDKISAYESILSIRVNIGSMEKLLRY
jgi:hypothetical protein